MKLSLIDKLKILGKLNTATNAVEEGINMKDSTKIILAIIAGIASILQIPSIQTAVVASIASHPAIAAGLAGLSTILAILHQPNAPGGDSKIPPVVPMLFLILCLGLMAPARVQAQGITIPPADGNNIGAAGLNYSVNASPSFAGSLLYARQALPASGTWVFANGDFLPNTLKPFTVTNNIGTGIAQKVADFGTTPIFCITRAGVSWTGTNTGYQFNGGCLAAFKVKNILIMPSGRFLKSSVSNGTGYQPIIGVYVGKRR
jgi:hypothetical protein